MRYQGDQNIKSWPGLQTKPGGQREGDNTSDAPFMKTPLSSARPLISSSFSLSALRHRCHSFLTPVCPFPLVSLSHLLLCGGGTVCFLEVCLWGKEYPAAPGRLSSLSAHHTEHDSPPSLWCWDELFLPSPWGVRIFCLALSFLNFTLRQPIDMVCASKRYLLWAVYTNIV